jgi:hypothetical protein
MGLFFYTQKGSIISMVDLPTTEIIEPKEDYLETFAVSEEVQLKELGEGLLKRTGQAVLRVLSPLF